MILESMPPLKNAPTGTSAIRCSRGLVDLGPDRLFPLVDREPIVRLDSQLPVTAGDARQIFGGDRQNVSRL